MKTKLIMSAFLRFRNIGLFFAMLAGLAVEGGIPAQNLAGSHFFGPSLSPWLYLISIGIYIVLVLQTLLSKEFHEKFNRKQKIRLIQDLNFACLRLANEAKKHTNAAYYQKLKKVMDDKGEIVNSYFKGEKGFLKEKIVEQTLNLVVSYIKLLDNFCIRSRELSEVDVGTIANRITANRRKLGFTSDLHAADDIKKVVELDERLIERLKEEKRDLERISAKLDYMESTVNMFKHQIMSSIESEDMLEKLETAVNEATALDSVLHERRKNRITG
jgi:hypothetical protein